MKRLFLDSVHLYDSEVDAIDNIIKHFLLKLEEDISNKRIASEGMTGYLMIIGEIFELISEQAQNKWLEYSYLIMEEFRKNILNGKVETLGIFGGFTDILFAVRLFNIKTGYYEKFLSTLENIMLDRSETYIRVCLQDIGNVRDFHYDLVSGLTGIGMYLLLGEDINNRKKEVLESILDYFICLCGNNPYQGHIVPSWHIKYENQTREADRKNFDQGNLNLGMAHGILGPLLVLSEAYGKGIIVKGQLEAIKKTIATYMKFKILNRDGVYNWPSQLKIEDFIDSKCIDRVREPRASWCYGNIGISRALHLISKNIGDNDLMQFSINNIFSIAKMGNKKYLLESPIICHGYSGILAIINLTHKEIEHPILRNKIHELIAEIISLYDEKYSYGFVNYGTIEKDGIKVKEYIESYDLLNGAIGVVLVLIAVMKRDTIWERQLYII